MPATTKQLGALAEYSQRQNMTLRMFRPQEHQEPCFTQYAREFIIRGGNRAGKSVCAAAKFASKALDIPITLEDGTQIESRKPWQKGRCLRMWVIGYDAKHIGQTIYRLLFKRGLIKIIKDKRTGLYRAFQPWKPEDAEREHEAKDAPPLIPARYVKPNSWDWENKKGKEFKSVTLIDPTTGEEIAEIYAYSSKADPKAGDPVDFIWIDEAIENPAHYEEWRSRLFDRRGELIWSSWPNVQNDALVNLSKRAEEQRGDPNALVKEHVIKLSQNKTIAKDVMAEALGMFATPEERRARDAGEFVTDLLRMYPWYDEYTHQAVRDGDPDEVSRIIRANRGIVPHEWTRELIIDPGSQNPAALFCAIPPPEILGACGSLSGVVNVGHFDVKVYPNIDYKDVSEDDRKNTFGWKIYPNPKSPSQDPVNWILEFEGEPDEITIRDATKSIHRAAAEWALRNRNRVGLEAYVIYDELAGDTVRQNDATMLAKKIKEKSGGLRFQRMIIDYRGGRGKGMGYEITTAENYRQALMRERVLLQSGEPWFIEGSDDVPGRIGKLQEWMQFQQNGLPRLRIIREKCPVLCEQLKRYMKKSVQGHVQEERPADRQKIDAAVALEYWAASHPAYVKPKITPQSEVLAKVVAMERRNRLKQGQSQSGIIGPTYHAS